MADSMHVRLRWVTAGDPGLGTKLGTWQACPTLISGVGRFDSLKQE